jgi:hypothetical protein
MERFLYLSLLLAFACSKEKGAEPEFRAFTLQLLEDYAPAGLGFFGSNLAI